MAPAVLLVAAGLAWWRADPDRPWHAQTMLVGVVLLVVTFANIFTIIQPVIGSGDWNSTLWMVGGPIFFSLLALGIYESYRRRMASGALVMES